MRIDREALDAMLAGRSDTPQLRLFQWTAPTVTYGYLLHPSDVATWAKQYGDLPLVQRPTGGGAVVHSIEDLSISLLWPRGANLFPENPRACYEAIHKRIQTSLNETLGCHSEERLVRRRISSSCEQVTEKRSFASLRMTRVPVCFQEPVCNDVMLDGKKIVGGALRVTKRAMLYQGTIQLPGPSAWRSHSGSVERSQVLGPGTEAVARFRSTFLESLHLATASA